MNIIRSSILVLAIGLATGCASRDGKMHSPFTGVSVHKAYALAEADGWTRVDEANGSRVWVRTEILAPINQRLMAPGPAQDRLMAAFERVQIAQTMGKTDAQIIRAYNPTGTTIAQVGDGTLFSAIVGGIAYGIYALNEESDESDSRSTVTSTDSQDRHDANTSTLGPVTAGDNSPVNINVNVSNVSE